MAKRTTRKGSSRAITQNRPYWRKEIIGQEKKKSYQNTKKIKVKKQQVEKTEAIQPDITIKKSRGFGKTILLIIINTILWLVVILIGSLFGIFSYLAFPQFTLVIDKMASYYQHFEIIPGLGELAPQAWSSGLGCAILILFVYMIRKILFKIAK